MTVNISIYFFQSANICCHRNRPILFLFIFLFAGQKIYNVGVLSVDFINVVIARTI